MLYLVFEVGENRLALPAARVVEVLPLLRLEHVPRSPEGMAGFFNYRGTFVPVIDLCQLIARQPAGKRLSTRIILLNFTDRDGVNRLAGLLAEQVTSTVQKDPAEFTETGVAVGEMPFLGPVARDAQGCIHLILPEKLLAERAAGLLAHLPQEVPA